MLEYTHLRWCAYYFIHGTNRENTQAVAMFSGNLFSPLPELLPSPLKAVVGMT